MFPQHSVTLRLFCLFSSSRQQAEFRRPDDSLDVTSQHVVRLQIHSPVPPLVMIILEVFARVSLEIWLDSNQVIVCVVVFVWFVRVVHLHRMMLLSLLQDQQHWTVVDAVRRNEQTMSCASIFFDHSRFPLWSSTQFSVRDYRDTIETSRCWVHEIERFPTHCTRIVPHRSLFPSPRTFRSQHQDPLLSRRFSISSCLLLEFYLVMSLLS